MSLLGNIPLIETSQRAINNAAGGGKSFFEFAGKTVHFSLEGEQDYLKAYNQCAPLKAVVNRRAQFFVNGKYVINNRNNDNPLRGEVAGNMATLFDRPNCLQTGKQWKAQHHIYIDIFGYCPVLKIKPVGVDKVTSMWNIPPWLFEVEFYPVKFWDQTDMKSIYKQFYINWGGKKQPLDMDAVFLVLDNGVGTDGDNNLLMPDARMKSQELGVSIDIASKKALESLITKKGAIGILSNTSKDQMGHIPLMNGQKEKVQDDFKRYGLTGQEWQIIITDANLSWQSMSYPTKDLMLFEAMTAAMAEICNGMGMYAYIMAGANDKGTTFTNLGEAKKSQYQDFIIPDDQARTEQLGKGLLPADSNAYVTVDYSHVESLQDSELLNAQGLQAKILAYQGMFDLGIINRNGILEQLGMPTINKPEFEQYSFEQQQEVNNDPNNKSNGKAIAP